MHSPIQTPMQRPWWQRTPSSSSTAAAARPASNGTKAPKKLGSLLGLKSKKSASALRTLPASPPSPVLPLHTGSMGPPPLSPRAGPSTTSRPTTQASWDEPRTPSDGARAGHGSYTQSVLTTEHDPFAAQYIPSSASMLESHRLSVFDGADAQDKADFTLAFNRESYTSSSENSHAQVAQRPPDVPVDVGASPPLLSPLLGAMSMHDDGDWRISRGTFASDKILRHEPFMLPPDDEPPAPQIRPSASTSTLRKTRARGLTDAPSPTVIVRQPSLSRAHAAPAAPPPLSTLPPTPSPALPTASTSSSALSFASYAPGPALRPPEPLRTLKKAASAHALPPARFPPSPVPPPAPAPAAVPTHEKPVIKKQRSFHAPRIPLPPLPAALRHERPSSATRPSSANPPAPGSPPLNATPSTRRRLFSGSSRRSTSSAQREDSDVRSLFSLNDPAPAPPMQASRSQPPPETGSFWDDDPPASPGLPQHIMAPADMLRLEAALETDEGAAAAMVRARARSVASREEPRPVTPPQQAPRPAPRRENSLLARTLGVPAPPPSRPRRPSTATDAPPSPSLSSPALMSPASTRPSTASDRFYTPPISRQPSTASSLASARSAGLSPPPRRERSMTGGSGMSTGSAGRRTSTVPLQPLSPPPAWRAPAPGPGRSRGPSDASERSRHTAGRAIARRPSFLEIGLGADEYGGAGVPEDEDEDECARALTHRRAPKPALAVVPPAAPRGGNGHAAPRHGPYSAGPAPGRSAKSPVAHTPVQRQPRGSIDDSFLDMGKSSFDTVRSDEL